MVEGALGAKAQGQRYVKSGGRGFRPSDLIWAHLVHICQLNDLGLFDLGNPRLLNSHGEGQREEDTLGMGLNSGG